MTKYYDEKYHDVRETIIILFERFENVEIVYLAGGKTKEELEQFINMNNLTRGWDITLDDWNKLVMQEHETREGYINIPGTKTGIILTTGETNTLDLINIHNSNWNQFKKNKLKKELKFNNNTIDNIEKDTFQILSHLNVETPRDNPVKGLVVGGVQSGKTTNMAALMAMAGDHPFNMVIILSGTIENLRLQTEARIQELIEKTNRNRFWHKISKPKNNVNEYLSNIYDPQKIYYSIVLKNKTRLEDLINWLTIDEKLMDKFSILIIDDEADQGSINTSKDLENRNTINRLIVNLVHSRNIHGKELSNTYKSVNYIGYTATPYANILSESPGGSSLYPKNFISILSESDQHFGPKEIFGLDKLDDEDDYKSLELDIIREVKDVELIKTMLKDQDYNLPNDLKESIGYFLAASASLRLHEFGKPVSMLIHISNKILDHKHIYLSIDNWLKNNKKEVLLYSKKTWEDEKNKLKLIDLTDRVSYNKNTSHIPHDFLEIENTILEIINIIAPIEVDIESKEYLYHKGIHTIVDHSKSNQYGEYDEEFRLNYPTKKSDLNKTPVFLVIGGATLSRGLTLEGLITSYFLRTPSTADTLTQMGRWFGYRINYELYPRIWMTNKTKNQFRYISTLEEELRVELTEMKRLGIDYSKVGPKIKYSPQYINLVAKNKSRDMIPQEYDFTGFSTQTYIFDRDINTQKKNLEITKKFVNTLGEPKYINNNNSTGIIWENISFEKIYEELIKDFSFNKRIKSLNSMDALSEWILKVTNEGKLNNFNVILGGKGRVNDPDNDWNWDNFSYNKVNRSELINKNTNNSEINIGVLRAPKDLFLDIDVSKIENKELVEMINKGATKDYNFVRNELKIEKTPQLFIYKIDGKSKANSNKRKDLNFDSDIIGLHISIPSGEKNVNYVTHVTIKIDTNILEENDMDTLEE